MALVNVAIYTTLRDKLGFLSKNIDAKNLQEIIDKLCSLRKDIPNILLDENGKVKNHFILTLNSNIVDKSNLKKVKLKDVDILHISPPVSGG
jgi:molybdopterin converting factor small subunit